MHSRCCWPPESHSALVLSRFLTSSHRPRAGQRLLDPVVHAVLHAVQAQAVGDVVVDRLGERVGPLEHHPDAAAHLDRVDVGRVEVVAVVVDLAATVGALDQVVHPVEAAKQRGLATARRTDERRHQVLVDLHVDVADRHRPL